ncbi:hypothetical protein HK102_013648 [Quaeritorhiza haematococci]|nr:hypothetical protein HK102_013648 [Quaeritorhiza haematococci]
MPESEHYTIFSESKEEGGGGEQGGDRDEFIFHVFRALCLGGRICQFEDEVAPYLETTKKIYKDLVSVSKDPKSQNLHITSPVYRITHVDSSNSPLFPVMDSGQENVQNFCYVAVDLLRRHVNVWYHASDSYYQ